MCVFSPHQLRVFPSVEWVAVEWVHTTANSRLIPSPTTRAPLSRASTSLVNPLLRKYLDRCPYFFFVVSLQLLYFLPVAFCFQWTVPTLLRERPDFPSYINEEATRRVSCIPAVRCCVRTGHVGDVGR